MRNSGLGSCPDKWTIVGSRIGMPHYNSQEYHTLVPTRKNLINSSQTLVVMLCVDACYLNEHTLEVLLSLDVCSAQYRHCSTWHSGAVVAEWTVVFDSVQVSRYRAKRVVSIFILCPVMQV